MEKKGLRIAAAAIFERGRVFTGYRHHEIIRDIVAELGPSVIPVMGEQGFVTDEGRFVSREDASAIAFQAGQILDRKASLFSEDIFGPAAAEAEGDVYEQFDRCVRGAGPHGHVAVTEREQLGRGSGKALFYWECTVCGQRSRKSLVIFVDRHGLVL